MTLVMAACAVCQGRAFQSVYPSTIPDTGSEAWQYFGSSRTRAGHLAIVRCARCGLMMTNPQDDPVTLVAAYGRHADTVYDLEYDNRRRAARRHLALVTKYRVTSARILDVGCATGAFVSAAHDAGWRAAGLDASEPMILRARIRCPGAVFHVGTLDDVEFPSEAFDVITLWDVLEHVYSPLEALVRLRKWLTPGGWLCLSVPNAGSVTARLMGRHWVLLLREHLWYFCPKTLGRLLSLAGFVVVETRPKLVQFSLANICRRVGQYRGLVPTLSRRLSRLPGCARLRLQFPIGEIDVVARAR